MNGNAHRWKAARRVAVLLCLSASTACTLGPDYERPEVAVPPEYRFDEPALASSGLVNGPAWWQSFGDQHLDGLIREAVENNRDLRIATARVDEFSFVLMGTRSQAFPQAGYGASASRDRRPEQGPLADRTDAVSNSFSTVITASWEIDLWGRIRRETEAARANLLASEEGRRGVVLTLVSSVILGYITLLDLDSQLRIAEATLEGRAEYVRLFRRRLEGGAISGFEMSLVEADYETAAATIPELRRIIAQQEDGLSVLLGRNPGPIARASSLDSLVAPAVPASLPAELLTRRPDILQSEQQLVASNALIGAARALYFPRISITGLAGLASAALGNLFTGSARTWSFVGDVSGPLFTGGGLAATVGQAEARREQALNAYELTIQNAFRDVDDSLIAVQMSGEVVAAFERRVASLAEGLRLARERYDNGYSDALDVLDTERNLFSAQLALADARGDRFRALVNLYRALGGDWVDEVAPLSPDQAQEGAGGQQP